MVVVPEGSVAAAVIALLFLFSPFRAGDGSYDGVVPPVASVQDEEKIYQETQENIPEETVPSVVESVPTKKLIAAARPDKPLQITGNEVPETEVVEEIQEQEKRCCSRILRKVQRRLRSSRKRNRSNRICIVMNRKI